MFRQQFFGNFPDLVTVVSSVPDPDPYLGFSVSDPGSGAFLAPGSGMSKKSTSGSGMTNRELRIKFLGYKLRFLEADRDPGIFLTLDPGSGINIPDPQHW